MCVLAFAFAVVAVWPWAILTIVIRRSTFVAALSSAAWIALLLALALAFAEVLRMSISLLPLLWLPFCCAVIIVVPVIVAVVI